MLFVSVSDEIVSAYFSDCMLCFSFVILRVHVGVNTAMHIAVKARRGNEF